MSPRRLRVYGWQGWRRECQTHHHSTREIVAHSTREIVAAHSQAGAARIAGVKGPWQLFNLCETGNQGEIEQAMSDPGTVFWSPLDFRLPLGHPFEGSGIVFKGETEEVDSCIHRVAHRGGFAMCHRTRADHARPWTAVKP